ncbi:MAG: FAD-binding protein [Candidatus Alcyoniella australis]|nr:FAD-binding protein [Candidatus Alcyoniella australis]
MGYTAELMDSIKRVEATRPQRVQRALAGEHFETLSLDQRQKRLEFHPDYRSEGRRPLQVGPSAGYALCHEVAEQLESYSRIDPDAIDLSQTDYETDVLVIGGGGAGTSAALLAAQAGAKVLIATKLRHGDANTMMAEGGIQAASKGHKDNPAAHYLDVMGGGHFKNTPELVETLVSEAPLVISWLESLGCLMSKEDDGRLRTMHGGGTCRKRMHYAADITGAEIMRTLRDEARNQSDKIRVIEFSPAIELLLDERGKCAGAVLMNLETHELLTVRARATVLATGGSGRLHIQGFMTTNHYGATADGIVIAYRAGVPVCFLHAVQYHPTGAVYPEQAEGILITEKVRGAGANVLNAKGEQFVNEREPRDVEAASIIRECTEQGNGVPTPTGKIGCWLDSPMIEVLRGAGTVKREFPGKYIMYKRYGIDISKQPMLIYPTLHYQNGGMVYRADTSCNLPGLFIAGEVGGGVHGENRLMGNSLLDVTVFGRIAGRSAAAFAADGATDSPLSLDHVRRYHEALATAEIAAEKISPMLLPDYQNERVKDRRLKTEI